MNIKSLQKNWDELGKLDPFWAIITAAENKGNNCDINKFFATGKTEIEAVIASLQLLEINLSYRKALDFGCGAGRLTQALADWFDEVHGVDIAPSMIELAQKHNAHDRKCIYHLNNQNNLRIFDDQSFDFIYTNMTLQHMQPQYSKNYLQEFLRVLSADGVLIFQLPSEQNYQNPGEKARELIYKAARNTGLLYSLYHQAKYGTAARMEMYGIRKEQVIELIESNSGKIVDIKPVPIPKWSSFQYYCRKK